MYMNIDTLIFSGGGVNGITFIGCISVLEELKEMKKINFDLKEVCGVSVGSIISFLLCIGYTAKELKDEVLEKDFNRLLKIQIFNMYDFGLDKGDRMIEWMESLLLRKLNKHREITFKELFLITETKLTIMAANLNKNVLRVFNVDHTPNARVLDVIRMSISVPFLFTKCMYENEIYVDGGLIQSYPITWYRKDRVKGILGFKLTNDFLNDFLPKELYFDMYISRIFACLENRMNECILEREYKERTISVTRLFSMMDVRITEEQKKKGMDYGYEVCKRLLEEKFNIHI